MVYDFNGPQKSISSGIHEISDLANLKFSVRDRVLWIESAGEAEVRLYSLSGLQRQIKIFPGLNAVGNLPAGLYIIHGNKIMIP